MSWFLMASALVCAVTFNFGRALGQREGTEEDRRRANEEMGPGWIRKMYSPANDAEMLVLIQEEAYPIVTFGGKQ